MTWDIRQELCNVYQETGSTAPMGLKIDVHVRDLFASATSQSSYSGRHEAVSPCISEMFALTEPCAHQKPAKTVAHVKLWSLAATAGVRQTILARLASFFLQVSRTVHREVG